MTLPPVLTITADSGRAWELHSVRFDSDHTVALYLDAADTNTDRINGSVELTGVMTADGICLPAQDSTRRRMAAGLLADSLRDPDTVTALIDRHQHDLDRFNDRNADESGSFAAADLRLALVRTAHLLPDRAQRAIAFCVINAGFTGTPTELVDTLNTATTAAATDPARTGA